MCITITEWDLYQIIEFLGRHVFIKNIIPISILIMYENYLDHFFNISCLYFQAADDVEFTIYLFYIDMFRRPLVDVTIMEGLDTKFECETELENVPVQWFDNSENIIDSSDRRQIHSFQERVHTLTISQTSLQDSGKYSINIKGCFYTVELNVKGNIWQQYVKINFNISMLDTV